LVRHYNRRRGRRPRRDRPLRQHRPENRPELQGVSAKTRGRGLQRQQIPPRHQGLHDPRRRFHKGRRNRRFVPRIVTELILIGTLCRPQHLRRTIRGRKLQTEALRSGMVVHGQRRKRHERFSILHHHEADVVARRKTRRLRQGAQGHGYHPQNREHQD
jgi:hypothetical protein